MVIIGLDSLSPDLLFERFRGELPTFSALGEQGIACALESCVPPITVPAWACMTTGVDPGTLGVYGFHQRHTRDYAPGELVSSLSHDVPTLWQLVGGAGKRSRVLGVPLTYPVRPLRGALVAGCLTPSIDVPYTYPPEVAAEVAQITGGYIIDVPGFRELAPERLLETIATMTARRFWLARAWLERSDWDFFMMVEMGSDRMHHGFLPRFDGAPDSWPDAKLYRDAVRNYYVALDGELAHLLTRVRPDDVLLVVSDHGTQSLLGSLALNDVLIAAGYLVLAQDHAQRGPLDVRHVDWRRTRAWAEGGYVGRIYANVRGREPEGCVDGRDLAGLLAAIEQLFVELPGPAGGPLRTRVVRPETAYAKVRGIAPDLMIYVDDLRYRAAGSVGHERVWLEADDRGRDRANHSQCGVLIMRDGNGVRQPAFAPTLYDVAPTVLDRLGIAIPPWMSGRVIR